MVRKAILLILLVAMLSVTFGCVGNNPYSSSANLRRAMIGSEQLRLVAADLDWVFAFDRYPTMSRYNR